MKMAVYCAALLLAIFIFIGGIVHKRQEFLTKTAEQDKRLAELNAEIAGLETRLGVKHVPIDGESKP